MTKGLANLRRLSLRDNEHQSIPSQLAPWSRLDMVDLSGNPFNWECDIHWLRKKIPTNFKREILRCFSKLELEWNRK